MKSKTTTIFLCLFLTALLPACKKERNQIATVERDCTGTYLHLDDKDYHVCNLEKISSFPNGAKVKVTFKKIKECNGTAADQIVCAMYHPNEGWIDVEKIE